MLLSRVAESVYWAGRYLERTEATCRLVAVHTELYLDLPKAAGLSWSPLLVVTGSHDSFHEAHTEQTEETVVAFLASDLANPGSIVSSIGRARENMRIMRALLPRKAWEVLNDAFLTTMATRAEAVDRRTRTRWCDLVIERCQTLSGTLAGTMSHDEIYSFLEVGRFIERADMTTRVLDVQSEILSGASDELQPYADVTWTSVLRTLSAHQMFLRSARCGVSAPEALRFLLHDPQFPRSVEHCLTEVTRALLELPRYDGPMHSCAAMQQILEAASVEQLADEGLHEFVDRLQLSLGDLHDVLTETYFAHAPSTHETTGLLATA
jgi:uncharacterized alpha-E superfamily protein